MKGMDVAVQKAHPGVGRGQVHQRALRRHARERRCRPRAVPRADSTIPDELKTEIDEIRYKLINGDIELKSKAIPKS